VSQPCWHTGSLSVSPTGPFNGADSRRVVAPRDCLIHSRSDPSPISRSRDACETVAPGRVAISTAPDLNSGLNLRLVCLDIVYSYRALGCSVEMSTFSGQGHKAPRRTARRRVSRAAGRDRGARPQPFPDFFDSRRSEPRSATESAPPESAATAVTPGRDNPAESRERRTAETRGVVGMRAATIRSRRAARGKRRRDHSRRNGGPWGRSTERKKELRAPKTKRSRDS